MLEDKIQTSFNKTIEASAKFKSDWRTSAYIVALERLEQTYNERGIFP